MGSAEAPSPISPITLALTWAPPLHGALLAPPIRPSAAPPDGTTFGNPSRSGPGASLGVAETLDERKPWLSELLESHAAALTYRARPVGARPAGGSALPAQVADGSRTHGSVTARSAPWSVSASSGVEASGSGGDTCAVGRREAPRRKEDSGEAAHTRPAAGVRSSAKAAAEEAGGAAGAMKES